jgi:hypothetical protein
MGIEKRRVGGREGGKRRGGEREGERGGKRGRDGEREGERGGGWERERVEGGRGREKDKMRAKKEEFGTDRLQVSAYISNSSFQIPPFRKKPFLK